MTGRLKNGLTQVYTGDGKGKTTAAIGLAVRAVGRGFNVYIGQFMKLSGYGEHEALRSFSDRIEVEQFGSGEFHVEGTPSEEEVKKARKGLKNLRDALVSNEYDIVIADEVCVAHHFELLELDDLLDLIEKKPGNVELIFTGRKAPDEVIEKADLVTEMKEVKHPYQEGVKAREGIEK